MFSFFGEILTIDHVLVSHSDVGRQNKYKRPPHKYKRVRLLLDGAVRWGRSIARARSVLTCSLF
eukprot:COSAG02_NODE_55532_length_290_cov_0.696335_1_plen_63_part_10